VKVTISGSNDTAIIEETPVNIDIVIPGVQGPQGPAGNDAPSDHGLLTGLADDDHTQYHNDARGDARYYTQSQVTTALNLKEDTLPSQTGNAGKFLTTDGTNKSWGTVTAPVWGAITGTLSSQTDLQTALDGKVDENASITGATKTKITYDAKGLVTSGEDATTADINPSTDRNYVTDSDAINLSNLSGINSGDQDLSGFVPYTGATADLDLGSNNLIASGVNAGVLGNVFSQAVIDLNNFVFYDGFSQPSINSNDRGLQNSSGFPVLNWTDSGNVGEIYGGNGLFSINLNTATLTNTITNTLNWNSMELIDSAASTTSINWSTRQLFDTDGFTVVASWGGYSGNLLVPLIATGVISNSTGGFGINVDSKQLIDSTGVASAAWETRELFDNTSVLSINFQNRWLMDAAGLATMYWDNRVLVDSAGTESVSWNDRWLINSSGDAVVLYGANYPTVRARLGISSDGLINPSNALHIDSGTATSSYLQFTAGSTTINDGFYLGLSSVGMAEIRQRENKDINVFTNNIIRAVFNNSYFQSTVPVYAPIASAAAPSYTFTGDTNTGMWSPAADTIALSTGGTEKARLTSAGLFGVGTNVPLATVHASDGNAVGAVITAALSTAGITSTSQSNKSIGSVVASNTVTDRPLFTATRARGTLNTPTAVILNDNIGDLLFSGYDGTAFQNSAGIFGFVDGAVSSGVVPMRVSLVTGSNAAGRVERIVIKSNGSVGIGTTTPTKTLEAGDSTLGSMIFDRNYLSGGSAGSSYLKISTGSSSGANAGAYMDLVGKFETWVGVYANNNPSNFRNMRFGNSTNAVIDTTNGTFAIQRLNDALNSVLANPFQISNAAPTNSLIVASTGNVGLGITTPSAKLDVAGTTKLGTSGTVFNSIISATATLDFPSIGSNSSADLTITVTGAVVGASVSIGAPSTLEAGLIFSAWVSATNTVTVRLHNNSGGSVDPASATWRATVINF
jgi:hypothetical protein